MENEYFDIYEKKYCTYQLTGIWFQDFHPFSKFGILLSLALTALVAQDYRYGFIMCIFYYSMAISCKKFAYFHGIFSKLILVIGLFIVVIRQLSVPGELVIFTLMGWRWTWEALENGLNMAFVILGFSGAVIMFYAATTMHDIMYALEQKGVSHTTSYLMLASFQTITDLKLNAKTILESQKSRGIETDGGLFSRAKAFMPVIGPLILGAISSAEEKYIAMDARAFSVKRKHTFLRELRPVPVYEKLLVALAILYFVAFCAFKIYVLLK